MLHVDTFAQPAGSDTMTTDSSGHLRQSSILWLWQRSSARHRLMCSCAGAGTVQTSCQVAVCLHAWCMGRPSWATSLQLPGCSYTRRCCQAVLARNCSRAGLCTDKMSTCCAVTFLWVLTVFGWLEMYCNQVCVLLSVCI